MSKQQSKKPKTNNRSGENFVNRRATTPGLPTTPIMPRAQPYNVDSRQAFTAKDMWNQRLASGNYDRVAPIALKDIYKGDRYDSTIPGTDYEEMHAQQQGSGEKWMNATTKMVGTAATTFVSGTLGLVWGAGDALINQRLASVVDNEVTRKMDDISMGMNDTLPNYYTQKETNAEWWSPDNVMTANFWSDKVLKNLGFSLGALAGGVAWGNLFRSIGMTNKLVRWGKGNDLATMVEKRMATAPAAGKFPAFQSALNESWSLAKLPLAAVAKNSDRILISIMATSGEATIEGLQAMHQLEGTLLRDFQFKYGRMPSKEEEDIMHKTVETAGLYVYGMNGLILTATNYIQLGKILGSSRMADKALINNVRKNANEVWEAAFPKTLPGKVLGFTKHMGRLMFAPVEAVEEGLQHAATTGVEDFFARGYANKTDAQELLVEVDNTMQNVYSNAYFHGLNKTFTTKEGGESMLIGALSGGLQQMGIVGRYNDPKTGKSKWGFGKSGNIGEYGWTGRGGERARNTEQAVEELNTRKIDDVIKDGVNFMGVGIGSQALRQKAIENDDLVAEKDAEEDYALSYLMPRIKYGKFESVIEELTNYKTVAMNPAGFSELQTTGIANQKETAEKFTERIDNLIESANQTKKAYSLLNDRYENARGEDGSILYTSEVIDKMVYTAAKVKNYDKRINELRNELLSTGVDLTLMNEIINTKGEKPTDSEIEAIAETADNVDLAEEEDFGRNLIDYGELLLLRKKYSEEYKTIREEPFDFQNPLSADPPTADDIEDAEIVNSIEVETADGGVRTYNTDDIYYLGTVPADKVKPGINISAPQMKILGMNEDGTIKIMNQGGKEIYLTKEELESLH